MISTPPPQGTSWIDAEGRLYVDTTVLKSVAKCSTQALVKYGYGYRGVGPPSSPLVAGSAIHAAIAIYLQTWDPDKAMAEFERQYHAHAEEHEPDPESRFHYDNVSRIVAQWIADHPRHKLPFHVRPDLIEVPFAIEIAPADVCRCGHHAKRHLPGTCFGPGEGVTCSSRCVGFQSDGTVFVGRMDMIGQNPEDNEWYVVDWKTTYQIREKWIRGFRTDPQLDGYLAAAQEHTHRTVVGAYIGAIEVSNLPNPSPYRTCRTHKRPYPECADQHTKKCTTHKVPWSECATKHIRTCEVHDVPYSECADQHMRSRIIMTTRSPEDVDEWKKDALKLAREFRDLLERFPTIESAPLLRTKGKWTGACPDCDLFDWCRGTHRNLSKVPTMLVHDPWRPWDFTKTPQDGGPETP